jgi:hypothetical protein
MPKVSIYIAIAAAVVLSGRATLQTSLPTGAGSVTPKSTPIVQELLAQALANQLQWLHGNSQPAAEHMAHTRSFTIFGPFGGPSPAGWNEASARAQAATAKQFQSGTADIELVQSYVSDKLIVLVMIERNRVRFVGQEGIRKWDLRVTQVYQHDGQTWKAVHRHADPLLARRDLRQTLDLLQP